MAGATAEIHFLCLRCVDTLRVSACIIQEAAFHLDLSFALKAKDRTQN